DDLTLVADNCARAPQVVGERAPELGEPLGRAVVERAERGTPRAAREEPAPRRVRKIADRRPAVPEVVGGRDRTRRPRRRGGARGGGVIRRPYADRRGGAATPRRRTRELASRPSAAATYVPEPRRGSAYPSAINWS